MALVLVATPGAANANSYLTLAEALAYFETRSTIQAWEDADSQEALLIMATRVLDAVLSPGRVFIPAGAPAPGYFRIRPTWTGAPTDDVQALAWPRIGMFTRNGFAIASTAIPQDLKDAIAELAGQLATEDRTLDNDVAVQGITSVKAGSVSVSFKSTDIMSSKMLPDMVQFYLVPSWITDELIEPSQSASFRVL